MANLDFSNKTIVKQSQLGVPIGNKVILGQLTSYNDGTAKWTYAKDVNPLIAGFGDRSTFTLYKDDAGKWNWTPTTSTSVSNLASREGFTEQQVRSSLYQTTQTQTVLNAGNVTNLGGINPAKKLGVPGTTNKATVTGPLPDTVSGAFAGQAGATQTSSETSQTSEVSKITSVDLNIKESGQQRDKAGSFGNYRYPEDIGSTKQDVIKFSMLKYQPRELTSAGAYKGGDLGGFKSRSPNRSTLGSVVLPITSGISESNAVEWNSQVMGPGEALAANIALTSIKEGLGKGADIAGGAASGVAGAGNENVKTAIATGFAEAATGVGNLLSRTQGAIFNPNMELLFNGSTLRPFQFTFKLSARSDKEAKQIIKIIRFFKQGMSPQRSESNLFLKAPHTFKIQYLYRPPGEANDHPYIGAIKECALQNFVVNYTPEAQYATFYDGVLVSYEIQMTFQELEPVFNEDYGNEGNEMPFDLLFRENPSTKP